jgi:hypothetical protein
MYVGYLVLMARHGGASAVFWYSPRAIATISSHRFVIDIPWCVGVLLSLFSLHTVIQAYLGYCVTPSNYGLAERACRE